MKALILSILVACIAALCPTPLLPVSEAAAPVGPRINGIQIGMNGDDAKVLFAKLSEGELVRDDDRSFDGMAFAGTAGRIRITSDNKLDMISLGGKGIEKFFGGNKLGENFLKQFINKYGIPKLEAAFVQDYAGMLLYNYTYIDSDENWEITFGVYNVNGSLVVVSMTLRAGETYSFN